MHLKAISCRVFTTRWFLPAFTIVLGAALGGAQWKGGDRQTGLTSMALFVAIAAVLFFGRTQRDDPDDPGRRPRRALGAYRHGGHGALWPHRDHGDHRRLRLGVGPRPRRHALRADSARIAGVAYIAALAVLRARS